MATAIQFANPHCTELFSFSTHFLHFVCGNEFRVRELLSRLLLCEKGDGCLKVSVHRPRHHRVHLANSVRHREKKNLSVTRRAFWPRRGRVLGWNDPTLPVARAPKKFFGVVPAHTRARKVSTMQMSAILIP